MSKYAASTSAMFLINRSKEVHGFGTGSPYVHLLPRPRAAVNDASYEGLASKAKSPSILPKPKASDFRLAVHCFQSNSIAAVLCH